MTRNRILVLLFCLSSTSAFASRATDMVMQPGDGGVLLGNYGDNGSFIYDDPYNMFYNPAYINNYSNWAIIEKSNAPSLAAEGGFVTSIATFNLGAFFDRGGAVSADFQDPYDFHPIQVLFGGDMGTISWGVSAQYGGMNGNVNGNTYANTHDLSFRAGMELANFEPFLGYENGLESVNGSQNSINLVTVGTRYHWGEWSPYAALSTNTFNGSTSTIWGLGLGRDTRILENVKMIYSVAYFRNTFGSENAAPLSLSFEGDVLKWLTLRAGLDYFIVDQTAGSSTLDNTLGRIGASFHFGKVSVDWAFGKQANGATQPLETSGGSPADAQLFDIGSGFFTAASVAYRW